ncbi:Agamous-like MADS-box protein AGL80 [Bienertia sinuspersici]
MARRRVKLAFIENDSSRRVTYKKRVKGLVKKTQELSVLCGVDVCTIVYGPYDQAPVVWPSCEAEAQRIISAFKKKPEVDQSERRLDQETYMKQSVSKAQEKLMKLQRRTREIEMENLISDIFSGKLTLEQLPPTNMGDLLWVIDDKLRSVEHRIRVGIENNENINPSASNDRNLISVNEGNDNPPTNPSSDDHNVISTDEGNDNPPTNPSVNDNGNNKQGTDDNLPNTPSSNDSGNTSMITTNEGLNYEFVERTSDVKEGTSC